MQAALYTQTRPSGYVARGKSRRCKPCMTGNVRAAATSAALDTGIITRLVGQQLLKMDQYHSVVPLLSSDEHQLPFAAALHIYHSQQQEQQSGSDDSATKQNQVYSELQRQTPTIRAGESAYTAGDVSSSNDGSLPSLVELMYVLSGSGYFSSAGTVQQISAADSIIAMQQQINIAAGAPSAAADDLQAASPTADSAALPSTDSTAVLTSTVSSNKAAETPQRWRNLVPWLQLRDLPYQMRPSDQLQKHALHNQQQEQPNQLVLLQLLLPSELLTGELDHYNAAHCQAVAQNLPWSSQHGPLQSEGCVDEHSVCKLLAGAPQAQQHSYPQEEQQQQSLHSLQPSVASHDGSSDSSIKHVDAISQAAASNSSSHHPTLPPLSPQQVLKRGLSEVGAFQLPAQTNRLALLFGPHASPAVCLSFGVEVFEPGHVTPLHIHTSAHELFFVLAGKGVGVHGPDGRERVELSAGDVAVFPPGVLHGIDNLSDQQLYCLQMMLPNESFVEWVRSGQAAGTLDVGALQRLAAAASCG